ncbi:uncharacterized protein SCHCODRAFT_02515651, partial [Schizophyllum commune H4-8]|uniref:uncharacterized protein n=1 Tax=Schizophyllum commune (strain H4-8 / FGSC 9210) TaxID=578458 RepID=UPI0021606CAD
MSRPAASPSKSLLWLAGLDPRNRARDDRASLSRLVHLSITLATPAFPGVLVPRLSTTATESLTSQPGAGNPHTVETTAQCPSTRRSACSPVHSSSIIEPLSVLEHAPVAAQAPSTPSSIASGPPHVPLVKDPVARLWEDAVREYQASAGVDHSSEGALLFSSKADIDDYVRDQEAQFKKFRNDGPQILRDRLMPVAIVLGKLCDGIGNSLAPAFPPGPVIFSAVGHLLRASWKASTTVHDEFDAVCKAFDEIKCRIVLIDTVVDRHVLVREASVEFLAHVLAVFGLISKMRRAGRFRVWLQGLRSARPMSEALAHLDKLGTRQHERVAAVTLEIVTELTSSLALVESLLRVVYLASVEEGNIQAIEEIHKNREIVRLIDGVVERAANDIKIMKDIAGVDKILGWLQYRDSSDKVNKLLNDRVPSTGSWFLNGGSFIEFKDGSVKSLLMSGSAGCGKSTMTAAAFQNLQDYRESHCSDATVLVYFFDITDRPDKQTTDSLISSFLCQLALQSSEAAAFLSAHRARAATRGHTTLEEKTALLLRLLRARRSPVYVLVDALDESVTKSIPPTIRWLQAHQAVSIFVTARTADGLEDLHDSHVRIGHFPRENDHDTNMILDRALTKPDGILAGVTDPLSIRTHLKRGAQGNLRWLSLVIDEIAPVAENPSYVSMLLTSLPQSLEAMYAQRLNSINPRLQQKVKILLAWLV